MIPALTHEVLKPPRVCEASRSSFTHSVSETIPLVAETEFYVFKPRASQEVNDLLCERSSLSTYSVDISEVNRGTQTDSLYSSSLTSKDVSVLTDDVSCCNCGTNIGPVPSSRSTSLIDKEQRLRKQQLTIEEFILDSRSKLERLRTTASSLRENIKPKRDIGYTSKHRTPRQQSSPVDCFVTVQALRASSDVGMNHADNLLSSPCVSPSPIRRRNINLWAQSPIEPLSKSSFPIVRPVTIEELGELERKK